LSGLVTEIKGILKQGQYISK